MDHEAHFNPEQLTGRPSEPRLNKGDIFMPDGTTGPENEAVNPQEQNQQRQEEETRQGQNRNAREGQRGRGRNRRRDEDDDDDEDDDGREDRGGPPVTNIPENVDKLRTKKEVTAFVKKFQRERNRDPLKDPFANKSVE